MTPLTAGGVAGGEGEGVRMTGTSLSTRLGVGTAGEGNLGTLTELPRVRQVAPL